MSTGQAGPLTAAEERKGRLTQLVVVGEAEAIDVPLLGDGEGEIRPAEGVLEAHLVLAAPAFEGHTLREQQPLCNGRGGPSASVWALPAAGATFTSEQAASWLAEGAQLPCAHAGFHPGSRVW